MSAVRMVIVMAVCGSLNGQEATVPAATPARPTVTIPAALPPTGYLQFEQGLVRAGLSPGGTASQVAVSQTTKIAVTDRLMIQAIVAPFAYSVVRSARGGSVGSSDPGDVDLGVQALLAKAARRLPAIAVGYIRRVRAGSSANIDAGEFAQEALIQIGGDLPGHVHYDTNIVVDEQRSGSTRRAQFLQTLAVSRPVALQGRLGGTVEISHFSQPFAGALDDGRVVPRAQAADLLFAGTFSPWPDLIFDASVDRGLTSTSTHWQGGVGVSYLLPHRLWRDRRSGPNVNSSQGLTSTSNVAAGTKLRISEGADAR